MKKVMAILIAVIIITGLCSVAVFAAAAGVDDAAATTGLDFGFAPVAAIVVICYLAAAALKATTLDNKWLPVLCGVLGGCLGALGLLIMPEYPAGDIMTAVAIGIVSGLAATGINQISKQLSGN